MKVIVLNGSPNGNQSVSLQYFHYIEKYFPQNEYQVIDIGLTLNYSNKDNTNFEKRIKEADLILWVFPVYFFNVPAQMKSFIELVFNSDFKNLFKNKYTSCITSSIKISDVTAHKYIQIISESLGMYFIEGYSAERRDIYRKEERKRILNFAECLFKAVKERLIVFPKFSEKVFINEQPEENSFVVSEEKAEFKGHTVLLYHSGIFEKETLKILEFFRHSIKSSYKSADLAEYGFQPCSGCFKCGFCNECTIKDGFDSFFNNNIKKANNLIFIIPARDAFIASEWKAFFDRMFFNNHVLTLKEINISYILYGQVIQKDLIYNWLEMFVVSQGAQLTEIVFLDDVHSEIKIKIPCLFRKIKIIESNSYQKPLSFYNIAFEKIIKSYVRLELAPVFYADSKYYRNRIISRNFLTVVYMFIRNIIFSVLFIFPFIRRIFYKNINPYTIKKMSKIVERN